MTNDVNRINNLINDKCSVRVLTVVVNVSQMRNSSFAQFYYCYGVYVCILHNFARTISDYAAREGFVSLCTEQVDRERG